MSNMAFDPERPNFSLEEELAMWRTADKMLGEESQQLLRQFIWEAEQDVNELAELREREIMRYANLGIRALADYVHGGELLVSEIENELRLFTSAQLSGDIYDRTEWHYYNSSLKERELRSVERAPKQRPQNTIKQQVEAAVHSLRQAS